MHIWRKGGSYLAVVRPPGAGVCEHPEVYALDQVLLAPGGHQVDVPLVLLQPQGVDAVPKLVGLDEEAVVAPQCLNLLWK